MNDEVQHDPQSDFGLTWRAERLVPRLVRLQRSRLLGAFAKVALAVIGVKIPRQVNIGEDFRLNHRGLGVVMNSNTILGAHVTVYHNVTIARHDSWVPMVESYSPVVIGDDAVLCPGSVILGGVHGLSVGRGTILGANSVLLESTGHWEIWAGSPARKVGERSVSSPEEALASIMRGHPYPRK